MCVYEKDNHIHVSNEHKYELTEEQKNHNLTSKTADMILKCKLCGIEKFQRSVYMDEPEPGMPNPQITCRYRYGPVTASDDS
jgi:hypothetical protein